MTTSDRPERPDAPRRPYNKAATIARVLQAARREFAANGLAGAHMDRIARAAGVTKQLLYQYYDSKDELFAAVLEQTAAEVLPKLQALDYDHLPPREALAAFVDQVFESYRDDPLLSGLYRAGMPLNDEEHAPENRFRRLVPVLVGKLEGIIARGVRSGDFRPGLDVRACVALIALLMTAGFTNSYMLSEVLGVDTASPQGMQAWRAAARPFILRAISRDATPADAAG